MYPACLPSGARSARARTPNLAFARSQRRFSIRPGCSGSLIPQQDSSSKFASSISTRRGPASLTFFAGINASVARYTGQWSKFGAPLGPSAPAPATRPLPLGLPHSVSARTEARGVAHYTGPVTTLAKIRLGWKYRRQLWKYRGLIRRRKELAGGAIAAVFLAASAWRSRR